MFASFTIAIRWGRNIYRNIRKFLQFQLAVNVVALFIVFLGSVVMDDPPFTSVQMLWVNMIMDTCGALALATEPPDQSVLKEMPYPINDSIINTVMYRNIFGQAIYQIAVLINLLFFGKDLLGL
jgi:magnesium-transporting ATPase (P-type)